MVINRTLLMTKQFVGAGHISGLDALCKSIPQFSFAFLWLYSPLAQLVEQVTVNHLVRGSSPRRGANKKRDLASLLNPFFCV